MEPDPSPRHSAKVRPAASAHEAAAAARGATRAGGRKAAYPRVYHEAFRLPSQCESARSALSPRALQAKPSG